jgi:hypothetical protein
MSPAELTKVRDALAATQTVNGVTSPAGAAVDVTIVEPSCATAMPAPSQSGAPQNAFDCNEQTAWMSATPFGDRAPSTFLVQLPGARAFDGVSLVGSAATPTTVTYAMWLSANGEPLAQLAGGSFSISSPTGAALPPVSVPLGNYSQLFVEITGATPIAINEVRLLGPVAAVPPAPEVTSISPEIGALPGGAGVSIAGTNLDLLTGVTFGSAPASVTAISPTTLAVVSPAGVTGPVDVTVTTIGGSSVAGQFVYRGPPSVTGLSPVTGYTTGGTSVTIAGDDHREHRHLAHGRQSGRPRRPGGRPGDHALRDERVRRRQRLHLPAPAARDHERRSVGGLDRRRHECDDYRDQSERWRLHRRDLRHAAIVFTADCAQWHTDHRDGAAVCGVRTR